MAFLKTRIFTTTTLPPIETSPVTEAMTTTISLDYPLPSETPPPPVIVPDIDTSVLVDSSSEAED